MLICNDETVRSAERMADAIDHVRYCHYSPDEHTFNPDAYLVPAELLTNLFAALDAYDSLEVDDDA